MTSVGHTFIYRTELVKNVLSVEVDSYLTLKSWGKMFCFDLELEGESYVGNYFWGNC